MLVAISMIFGFAICVYTGFLGLILVVIVFFLMCYPTVSDRKKWGRVSGFVLCIIIIAFMVLISYQAKELGPVEPEELIIPATEAWALGGGDPYAKNVTSLVREKDGNLAPPYCNREKSYEYFSNVGDRYFHALSLGFNIANYTKSEYEVTLQIYLRKGEHDNSQWHHYAVQRPTILVRMPKGHYYENTEYDDLRHDEIQRLSHAFPDRKSLHWIVITIDKEDWMYNGWDDNRFWVQVRLWNAAIDKVVLRLMERDVRSIVETIIKWESPLLGLFLYSGAIFAWIADPAYPERSKDLLSRLMNSLHLLYTLGRLNGEGNSLGKSIENGSNINEKNTLGSFIEDELNHISKTILTIIAMGIFLRTSYNYLKLDKVLVNPPIVIHQMIEHNWIPLYLWLRGLGFWSHLEDTLSGPLAIFYMFLSFLLGIYAYGVIVLFQDAEG